MYTKASGEEYQKDVLLLCLRHQIILTILYDMIMSEFTAAQISYRFLFQKLWKLGIISSDIFLKMAIYDYTY